MIICRIVPIYISVIHLKYDGRWRGSGAEKQSLEFTAEETTEKKTTITFRILPGCEWHEDAVKLCNYLMIDAGKEPGRGSVAGSSRVFSRLAAPPTAVLLSFLR